MNNYRPHATDPGSEGAFFDPYETAETQPAYLNHLTTHSTNQSQDDLQKPMIPSGSVATTATHDLPPHNMKQQSAHTSLGDNGIDTPGFGLYEMGSQHSFQPHSTQGSVPHSKGASNLHSQKESLQYLAESASQKKDLGFQVYQNVPQFQSQAHLAAPELYMGYDSFGAPPLLHHQASVQFQTKTTKHSASLQKFTSKMAMRKGPSKAAMKSSSSKSPLSKTRGAPSRAGGGPTRVLGKNPQSRTTLQSARSPLTPGFDHLSTSHLLINQARLPDQGGDLVYQQNRPGRDQQVQSLQLLHQPRTMQLPGPQQLGAQPQPLAPSLQAPQPQLTNTQLAQPLQQPSAATLQLAPPMVKYESSRHASSISPKKKGSPRKTSSKKRPKVRKLAGKSKQRPESNSSPINLALSLSPQKQEHHLQVDNLEEESIVPSTPGEIDIQDQTDVNSNRPMSSSKKADSFKGHNGASGNPKPSHASKVSSQFSKAEKDSFKRMGTIAHQKQKSKLVSLDTEQKITHALTSANQRAEVISENATNTEEVVSQQIEDLAESVLTTGRKKKDPNGLFQDAMKLGGAIMSILNMSSKKHAKYKQRYFDQWKLYTLYAVGAGREGLWHQSEVKRARPDRYSIGQNSADSEFIMSNFSSAEKSDKDYLPSQCIQIVHQSRPIILHGSTNSLHDETSSAQNTSLDEMKMKHAKDMKVRKCIHAIFRFKARQMANRFYNWKYMSKYITHLIKERRAFRASLPSELLSIDGTDPKVSLGNGFFNPGTTPGVSSQFKTEQQLLMRNLRQSSVEVEGSLLQLQIVPSQPEDENPYHMESLRSYHHDGLKKRAPAGLRRPSSELSSSDQPMFPNENPVDLMAAYGNIGAPDDQVVVEDTTAREYRSGRTPLPSGAGLSGAVHNTKVSGSSEFQSEAVVDSSGQFIPQKETNTAPTHSKKTLRKAPLRLASTKLAGVGINLQVRDRNARDGGRSANRTARRNTGASVEASLASPTSQRKGFQLKNGLPEIQSETNEGGENLSSDDCEVESQSTIGQTKPRRIVNELEAKLPFSDARPGDQPPIETNALPLDMQGQINRSKEIPLEKQKLYMQVLESSNKDFQSLLKLNDTDVLKIHDMGEHGEDDTSELMNQTHFLNQTKNLHFHQKHFDQNGTPIKRSLLSSKAGGMLSSLGEVDGLQYNSRIKKSDHQANQNLIQDLMMKIQRQQQKIQQQERDVKLRKGINSLLEFPRLYLQHVFRTWAKTAASISQAEKHRLAQFEMEERFKKKGDSSIYHSLKYKPFRRACHKLLQKKTFVLKWQSLMLWKEGSAYHKQMIMTKEPFDVAFQPLVLLDQERKDERAQAINYYQARARFHGIIQTFEHLQQLKSESPSAATSQGGSPKRSPSKKMKALDVKDIEFIQVYLAGKTETEREKVPKHLMDMVAMYEQQKEQYKLETKHDEIETRVKKMCYDLMLTVLDEQVVDKERRQFQADIIKEGSPPPRSPQQKRRSSPVGGARATAQDDVQSQLQLQQAGDNGQVWQGQGSNVGVPVDSVGTYPFHPKLMKAPSGTTSIRSSAALMKKQKHPINILSESSVLDSYEPSAFQDGQGDETRRRFGKGYSFRDSVAGLNPKDDLKSGFSKKGQPGLSRNMSQENTSSVEEAEGGSVNIRTVFSQPSKAQGNIKKRFLHANSGRRLLPQKKPSVIRETHTEDSPRAHLTDRIDIRKKMEEDLDNMVFTNREANQDLGADNSSRQFPSFKKSNFHRQITFENN